MIKKLYLIAYIMISFFLVSCTINDDDSNINYNNDGDVNILDNFKSVDVDDIEISQVYEIQYDIDTVPTENIQYIIDVDKDNNLDGCFQYILSSFNISVDSVEHFISDDTEINLTISAEMNNTYLIVHQETLEGIAFSELKIEQMFDEDINIFVYNIEIIYKGNLINTIVKNVKVNGMLTARDWFDYND